MSHSGANDPAPTIPGYRVLRLLGQGGMGSVYLAQDETLSRPVAVKVVVERSRDSPAARARFLREARAMATVEHPAVVRIYSYGEHQGAVYFVMEYVEGETLADRMRRGRLPVDETLRLLGQMLDGLEAAWEKGVVHRDVKPGNVLLDRKGNARMADFGLAKPLASEADQSLTDTGAILGTPYYVSPEQARGLPVDLKSDIYSLGIVAFEMLSGNRPFFGTTSFEIVAKHLHEPLPDLRLRRPELPEPLIRTIEWMTAKDPAARPASYRALRDALLGGASSQSLDGTATRFGDAPPLAAPPRRQPPSRSRAVIATVLLLATLGTVWGAWRARSRPVPDSKQLVVAVTPFFGLDADSTREGRTLGALVEREVARRLGSEGVRVLGIEETRQPVRDQAAAQALGEQLGASVVVWGDAFTQDGRTEIQPSFTIVTRGEAETGNALRAALAGRDPSEALREIGSASKASGVAGPIDLRRTSAAGVGDLVMVLAGMHTLYTDGNPEKALGFFERAPRSVQSLRYRAEALWRLGRRDAALAALADAVTLDPNDAQAHATLGDFLIESERLVDAERELRRAAELGGSYATRNGIVFEGKLYIKETSREWREGMGRGQQRETGYLLAVDAASGRVLERHHPPGIRQLSLGVRDGVLRLSYAAPQPVTATFANGRFEKPVFGSDLLTRRRGIDAGRLLAMNFLDKDDRWRSQPDPKTAPWAPATLPDLEARLRAAIARDPTQPWHLLYLGQVLRTRGHAEEAQRAWTDLFEGKFSETPYYEYASMARALELLEQPQWADRAYAEALARRKQVPQPIAEAMLIERLINVPFVRVAAVASRSGGDLARAHLWLTRARELSGIVGEGDGLVAQAWARYFEKHGDAASAQREARAFAQAKAAAGNIERSIARFDLAVQLFLALSVAWWLLVGLLWVSRPSTPLPRRLAGDSGDRRILLAACLLSLSSFGYVVAARGRVRALESMPVVVMDSLGSAENVFLLERRLAALDAVNLRVATAIANHMAGNLDRARELYQRLIDEPRVSRNRSALMNGEPAPPDALTHEDLIRAYEDASWSDWLQMAAELRGIRPLAAALVLDLGLLLGLVIVVAFGARIALPQAIAWNERRRAIPGSADLARGRTLRTYVTLALISFAFVVTSTQVALRSSVPSMGVESALYQTSLRAFPLPFPPGTSLSTDEAFERGLRVFYWDFLRARPAVPLVWALAFLGGVTAVALHLAALRDLRLAAEPAAGAEPPGTARTEPAPIDSAETSAKPPAKRSA